jgi:hypothetical protein
MSPDFNVEKVRDKLLRRSYFGLNKYGTTTERTDLSRLQWLIHAQEESMDLAVYLQQLIEEENARIAHTNATT